MVHCFALPSSLFLLLVAHLHLFLTLASLSLTTGHCCLFLSLDNTMVVVWVYREKVGQSGEGEMGGRDTFWY